MTVMAGVELGEHHLEWVFQPRREGLRFNLICAACREHFGGLSYEGDGSGLRKELERRLSHARQALQGEPCPAA